MNDVDFLIIGAGVIGLAIAADLSNSYPDRNIVVLERHERFGMETSSRNSEVIHAGIYYPEGSLKARLCVEGKKLLYNFCQKWNVPHASMGKLIVARNPEDLPSLESLMASGIKNGVKDLALLDSSGIHTLEPNIKAPYAIYSPSTGVIDSHCLMARLEMMCIEKGVCFGYRHRVDSISPQGQGYSVVFFEPNGKQEKLRTRWVINSAGLFADEIAKMLGIKIEREKYKIKFCKGEYFQVTNKKKKLVSRLVYSLPQPKLKSLGIHLTKTLDGRLRVGPNAFYVDRISYEVEESHKDWIFNEVSWFMPCLEKGDLAPESAGIRPKLYGQGEDWQDFIIQHEKPRGLPGLINMIGIESPGLTSCLALAQHVKELISNDY